MKVFIVKDCNNPTEYIGGAFKVEANGRSCLFCLYCTDFFYDFTNGPYLFFCKKTGEAGQFPEIMRLGCEMFEEAE